MPFVLDCSMTMAWIFADEETTESQTLRESLREDFALAPSLWSFEVGNVLLTATRRKRIAAKEWPFLCEILLALPIEIDHESPHRVWDFLLPIAAQTGLSVYDASYLELALRQNLPLATLDKKLQSNARKMNIEVIG